MCGSHLAIAGQVVFREVLRRMLNDPRNLDVEPACVESVVATCLEKASPDEALQVPTLLA